MKKRFKSKRKKHSILLLSIYVLITNLITFNLFKMYDPVNNKFKIDLKKENILLDIGLNYKNKNIEQFDYVFKEMKRTIILYSTHDNEDYKDGTIKDASEYLRKKLESLNYNVIKNNDNIYDYVKKNNLEYKDSYKISREFITNNLNDNVSLVIDLHRDSGVNTTYNEYAKLMFVVGAKHDTYKNNYKVCNDINNMIKNINPNISRGIFTRESSSYNQDLSNNIILIELGSNNNTMKEVNNTIDILVESIDNYLSE